MPPAGVAALPPLRETIAKHGLDARKRFGQHFLLDLNLTRRIARAAQPIDQGTVIEVDPRALDALAELREVAGGRLQLIEADALTIDPASLGPAPHRIVANLPYNISTPLLVRWLQQADAIADMVLMFQKEVVDRLVAPPRTKDYGRLSVLAQHVCEIRRLFDIPAAAF